MTNKNYGNGVYPEWLSRITETNPLVVESHFGSGIIGPHYVGAGWNPIDQSVVRLWLDNNILELAAEDTRQIAHTLAGKAQITEIYILSEFGQRCANRKLTDAELDTLNWSAVQVGWKAGAKNGEDGSGSSDEITEGLLFSSGGTCQLCGKKMDIFGQISHAKSHISKGDPVLIEEINGKKIARISGEHPTPPRELEHGPVPPVDMAQWVGNALFTTPDTTGRSLCQLCPAGPPVHKFGQTSHAKMHITRKDPVEIRTIHKKSVPMITGTIVLDSPTGPKVEPLPIHESDMTPADFQAREQGIDALLSIQRAAGLDGDRDEAAANWDKMGPVSRLQTIRTAAKLEE